MLYRAEGKAVVGLPRHYMNFKRHQDLCTQLHVLAFPPAPEPPIAVPCSEALSKRIFFSENNCPIIKHLCNIKVAQGGHRGDSTQLTYFEVVIC